MSNKSYKDLTEEYEALSKELNEATAKSLDIVKAILIMKKMLDNVHKRMER